MPGRARLEIKRGIALAAAAGLALLALTASAPDPAHAGYWKECKPVKVGGSKAQVRKHNVGCATARKVVRRFTRKYPGRKGRRCAASPCRVGKSFRCLLADAGGFVEIGCSNARKNDADILARWSD